MYKNPRCNEYDQCRHSRERQCRVPSSYCPNKQTESCRNECAYSPNTYNTCTEQTLRWLCRYKLENRRSCSAPPRRRLTYEGGTISVENRGKPPRRPRSSSKSRKKSPRKKSCTNTECTKKVRQETCPQAQCELSDIDRKNMEEKLRSLKTCGQPGCQASRQKRQIEEAVFGSKTMQCDAPTAPCCLEKVRTQVSLKAQTYQEETQGSLKSKTYKEARKSSSLVQEHEYLYFMLGITEDILKTNKYTVDAMEKVFRSHIAAHRGRLDEAKMQEHIDHLKTHLKYPICICDESMGSDDNCRCCPALTIDPTTNERRKCSCEDSRCPTHAINDTVVIKREESGGTYRVGSREGSGIVRKPSVDRVGEKRGSGKSSQSLITKKTGSSSGKIRKGGSGTGGGGGEGKTKTDDVKKKAHGTTGKKSSSQEMKTRKSSSSVEKRVSGGSKEKITRTASDNTQECIDPAGCSTNPGNPPATSLSKANFTISGIDNVRIRETSNGSKPNGKTEDKLSEVVFYNPEVGSTCHCTIAIRKTALKIQSDNDGDNEEYVLVEGPVCMPKKMLQQMTVPVLIENISSMILDSNSDFGDHQKREGPSESRVNLFQSSTARNSIAVDANLADSISGYITIADLKNKGEQNGVGEETENDRSKGARRQSIVQIKPNVSYISITVSYDSKNTESDQAKTNEAKKTSSGQAKKNSDKEIVKKTVRKEKVVKKGNSSVYHERGGVDMLNQLQADEVKTMSEPKMKTNYSYMSYIYESWTRLITSDADIKYFSSGDDKKGFVIKPAPRKMKPHKEEKELSCCNSESSEECFYIPRRIKSENLSSNKEIILNDFDNLLQKNDTKISLVERQLTDADQDIAILRKQELETEISNDTMQSEGNTLNDTETPSVTNNDYVDGKPKNINTLRSLDLEGMDVEYKIKSETRVSQHNIAKQQESLAEIFQTDDGSKATCCAEAKETESKKTDSSKSLINDQTSLEVEMKGSKNKLTNNNQVDYQAALARFEHLKPKLKNITITKSDPTHDRHASKTFRLCTGEKTKSGSIHVIHIRFPKSKEVIPKLDTVSAEGFVVTTDEPPSEKDLSDFRSKYHYLLQDAITNVTSTDFCNTDDAQEEILVNKDPQTEVQLKEQIQANQDPQTDVPCDVPLTAQEPVTAPSPIVIEMPVLVPSVSVLEEAQLQGGSSPFYFPQLATGYLTRPTRPSVSQTHDQKQSHTDDKHRPPDSDRDTHDVTNAKISKEENLPGILEFSSRGQKRSMDFASRPGGGNSTLQRKRQSGIESSATKNPVLDKDNSYRSPIPFPTQAASVSSTDGHSSSLSETSVMLLRNKERPAATRSLNLEGDAHADIIAQLDEIPEPDRTPNQISTIRDVTMRNEDFRTIDPSSVGRQFPYTNPESFNIRRESFEY